MKSKLTEKDLIHIINDLVYWAYEVNGNEGAQDAMNAAALTPEEIKELGLEEYLEEEDD